MGINIDELARRMEDVYYSAQVKMSVQSLEELKKSINNKCLAIKSISQQLSSIPHGKITKEFVNKLNEVSISYGELANSFDDKLMIFIVGNGCTGKSTLLNSLIGYEVAQTNALPNTWKIDVYSPTIEKDKALVKYFDGHSETISISSAEKLVEQEEERTTKSKSLYNEQLKREIVNCKTKDARDELKRYLGKKYLYKSNVAEVRWSVNSNRLLENCLLVDTPGLNQNLNDFEQLGSIKDYYHKADGVIWMLDGSTIAAKNTESLLDELKTVLKDVGGVRENIIGVINRIDNVYANGGQAAVNKVLEDAHRAFGKYFAKIVHVSALQAYQGITENNSEKINNSNIRSLESAINEIFVSKAGVIKSEAKAQGSTKLIMEFEQLRNAYMQKINEYTNEHKKKREYVTDYLSDIENSIRTEIDAFFDNYLSDTEKRINNNIDSLEKGNEDYVIYIKMYDLEWLEKKYNSFLSTRHQELKNTHTTMLKNCTLSEYRYIKGDTLYISSSLRDNFDIDLSNVDNIEGFDYGDDIISGLVGFIDKLMRKRGLCEKIYKTIKTQCEKIKSETITHFLDIIHNNMETSLNNRLDETYQNLLFNIKKHDNVISTLTAANDSCIYHESEDINVVDFIVSQIFDKR